MFSSLFSAYCDFYTNYHFFVCIYDLDLIFLLDAKHEKNETMMDEDPCFLSLFQVYLNGNRILHH